MVARKKEKEELKLNLSPMIDVVFLILIYFIVSMQMEPSLDNIIKLPPVFNAVEQDSALLQIYVLPAKVKEGGLIDGDSTGLVAFSDKSKLPDECPVCQNAFKDKNGLFIPGSLLDSPEDGKPVQDLQNEMAQAYGAGDRPPAFFCAQCKNEISPYLKISEIPGALKKKKAEILETIVEGENSRRREVGLDPLTDADIESLKKGIKLMIKADNKSFYGRILQVVNMAKDTASDISQFAFITRPDASKEVLADMEKTVGEAQ